MFHAKLLYNGTKILDKTSNIKELSTTIPKINVLSKIIQNDVVGKLKDLNISRITEISKISRNHSDSSSRQSFFIKRVNEAKKKLIDDTFRLIRDSKFNAVHRILDRHGIDTINEVDEYNNTLLYYAIIHSQAQLVEKILRIGGSPFKLNANNENAIDIATDEPRIFKILKKFAQNKPVSGLINLVSISKL